MTDQKLEELFSMVKEMHNTMMGSKEEVGCIHEHRILWASHEEFKKLKNKVFSAIILSSLVSGGAVTAILKVLS